MEALLRFPPGVRVGLITHREQGVIAQVVGYKHFGADILIEVFVLRNPEAVCILSPYGLFAEEVAP